MELRISLLDTAVIFAYLATVVWLGIRLGRDNRDLTGYLLGDRNLPWWALLGSIVATETSTATFLSVPGESYKGDFRFLQLALGYIVGRVIVAWVMLPRYAEGSLYSAYDLLEKRFGGLARPTASGLFLIARNLGDGLRLFLAALALQTVTGFALPINVLLVGVATIVYTFFGGMRSVVWNDCLQFVIYTIGALVAVGLLIGRLPDGWTTLSEFAAAGQKWRMFDFQWDPTEAFTFWAGLIGGAVLSLGTHGTDQMLVQRYLCARNLRDARLALVSSGFVVFAQFALFLFVGVALAAFYDSFPMDSEVPADQIFALFIVEELPVGVVGLVLASVFAAAMSTLSSSLNSSSAAFVNDLYTPYAATRPDPDRQLRMSRRLTIVFGILQMLIALGGATLENSVVTNVLTIAGLTAGVLLGVFLIGLLTIPVDHRAVTSGMLIGLTTVLVVWQTFSLAWPWFPLVSATGTATAILLLNHMMADSLSS